MPKKKSTLIIMITLIVINILLVLGIIFGSIDKARLEKDQDPIFSVSVGPVMDGTQIYLGLGYKIYKYPRTRMDIVDIGTWFLEYKDGYAPGNLTEQLEEFLMYNSMNDVVYPDNTEISNEVEIMNEVPEE